MSKTYSKTRTLVECALMIALGTVLANIKIFEMPNGGSITLFRTTLERKISVPRRSDVLPVAGNRHATERKIATP